MTRKFLLAALVILLAALCTIHLTTERTPPENVVSPAVHLGMVVPREALEKLKAAETAALAAPQTAEPTGRRDSGACGGGEPSGDGYLRAGGGCHH